MDGRIHLVTLFPCCCFTLIHVEQIFGPVQLGLEVRSVSWAEEHLSTTTYYQQRSCFEVDGSILRNGESGTRRFGQLHHWIRLTNLKNKCWTIFAHVSIFEALDCAAENEVMRGKYPGPLLQLCSSHVL